jgi:hypothetical protein
LLLRPDKESGGITKTPVHPDEFSKEQAVLMVDTVLDDLMVSFV